MTNRTQAYSIAGLLLLLVGLGVAYQNSLVISQVSIRLLAGTREHRDHSLGSLGKEHELPDYRVKLNIHRRLSHVDLGTRLNTSATNWIDFPVSERVFARRLQEIIVIEDDKVENDVLDRFPIVSSDARGLKYEAKASRIRTWDAGLDWFVREPAGLSLLLVSLGLLVAGAVESKRKPIRELPGGSALVPPA